MRKYTSTVDSLTPLSSEGGFGLENVEAERTKDIRSKIQRKLGKWANRFLSWTLRVLLLQHVLRAIPTYHFLGLGLLRNSYKSLEAPCKAFLWGTNAENKAKTSLVSWESVSQLKRNGGLQIRPFHIVADVLKMRYVGRLLNGDLDDWAQIMGHFIREQMQQRPGCREAKLWSVEEGLLLLPTLSMPHSETTRNVLQGWFKFRKFLRLDEHTLVLPGSITLRQLQDLMKRYRTTWPYNDRTVHPLLKRLGIRVLTNLADATGKWIMVANALRARGIQLDQTQEDTIQVFQTWLGTVQMGVQKLEHSPSWRWKGSETKWTGWTQPTSFWHNLYETEETPEDLSAKWPDQPYALDWKARWLRLWGKGGSPRVKLLIWKILRRAYFTGERAATLGKPDTLPEPTPRHAADRLFRTRTEIEGGFNNRSSADRWQKGIKALEELNSLLKIAESQMNSARSEVDNEEHSASP
ncbi:hypothetical protein R1flu_007194 [Riccia fluitans]|uniref:Uncharacterized protein n=1 Tax=Riccia fluitans TaxID=41844 RepID=A0ABD1YYE6_9MARC